MHLHGFEPQEGTIKDFVTFWERLESSLEDPELKPHKKTGSSNKEKDKKKGKNDCSNSKKKCCRGYGKGNEDKPLFCLIHGKNSSKNSNQCCNLHQDAEKHKEERKKNGVKSQCAAGKHEIHTIMEFAKQEMESAKQAKQKEGE